jgi:hypothetical protein
VPESSLMQMPALVQAEGATVQAAHTQTRAQVAHRLCKRKGGAVARKEHKGMETEMVHKGHRGMAMRMAHKVHRGCRGLRRQVACW